MIVPFPITVTVMDTVLIAVAVFHPAETLGLSQCRCRYRCSDGYVYRYRYRYVDHRRCRLPSN